MAQAEKLFNDTLEPYARELGLLVYDWNRLHLEITNLYLEICLREADEDEEREILLAIWNAVPNERLQRNMVLKAAQVKYSRITSRMEQAGLDIEPIRNREVAILDSIQWILSKADVLGRLRDDSVHLPIILEAGSSDLSFKAYDDLGHPIAAQLAEKELLGEFKLYRLRIETVITYLETLLRYLNGENKQSTLPGKPQWPAAPLSSVRKVAKGPKRAKQHPRPPRS